MVEIIALLCGMQVCYVSPDHSIIQIPIATMDSRSHPDDRPPFITESGVMIKFIPKGQDI